MHGEEDIGKIKGVTHEEREDSCHKVGIAKRS